MAKTNAIGNKTSALTINEAYTLPTSDGAATTALTTNGGGTVSWQPLPAGRLTYEEVTAATKTMANNYAYGANRAGGVTFTLPATSSIGDEIRIIGIDGIWLIDQGASQTIYFGTDQTTVGATGVLTSSDIGDCITIKCITADKEWRAICGWGNFIGT